MQTVKSCVQLDWFISFSHKYKIHFLFYKKETVFRLFSVVQLDLVETQWFCDCAIHFVKDLLSVHTTKYNTYCDSDGHSHAQVIFMNCCRAKIIQHQTIWWCSRVHLSPCVVCVCVCVMDSFWIYPDNCTGALFWHNSFHHVVVMSFFLFCFRSLIILFYFISFAEHTFSWRIVCNGRHTTNVEYYDILCFSFFKRIICRPNESADWIETFCLIRDTATEAAVKTEVIVVMATAGCSRITTYTFQMAHPQTIIVCRHTKCAPLVLRLTNNLQYTAHLYTDRYA